MKRTWIFLLVALAAGCAPFGTSAVPLRQSQALDKSPAASGSFRVLYTFNGKKDARESAGGLVLSNGVIYGVGVGGGSSGYGAVYGVSTQGKETLLASLSSTDALPQAGPAMLNGTVYGGVWGYGGATPAIYAVAPNGKLSIAYKLDPLYDGNKPGQSVAFKGAIYGILQSGYGAIFRYTPSGSYKIVHSFGRFVHDGVGPNYYITAAGGRLFGATSDGGTSGHGTVYSFSPSGGYRTLYSFKGGSDGDFPLGSVTFANGHAYGMTYGGARYGTAYSVTLDGKETVLYRFKGRTKNDCEYPSSDLIYVKGALYGVCSGGGYANYGLLFRLTLSGQETILHAFTGGSDGSSPLWIVNGGNTLYGITTGGSGSVFSYTL